MEQRQVDRIVARILKDLRVELHDEFDRNFERQGFFSQAWQRRAGKFGSGRTLLVDTGGLRRSIRSTVTKDSITFTSDHPAAEIHNDGGEIAVTKRMKKYFWYRYIQATGGFGRRKDGSLRKDKRNERLTSETEFWKAMALKKEGTSIKIPRRRFLGHSPEVEQLTVRLIESNLNEFFEHEFKDTLTKQS